MSIQPDLLNPTTLEVEGIALADTIHDLQRDGAVITRMEQGRTNGEWRLSLYWPQPERKP